jgi:hypothetical protein
MIADLMLQQELQSTRFGAVEVMIADLAHLQDLQSARFA